MSLNNDIIVLFLPWGQMIKEEKIPDMEKEASKITGKKCIVMPVGITNGLLLDDILFLFSPLAFSGDNRAKTENKLSSKVGKKCIIMPRHITNGFLIKSTE